MTVPADKTNGDKQTASKNLSINQSGGVSSSGQIFFFEENVELQNAEKNLSNELKEYIFVDVKAKRDKILYMCNSGNFDTRRPPPPFYIILPNSRTKIFWDVFICLLTVWNLVIVPIDIGWNVECFTLDKGATNQKIYTISSVVFFVDFIINFITAVLSAKNEYLYELDQIFKIYVKDWFIYDCIGMIPFSKFYTFDNMDCFSTYISTTKIFYFFYLVRILKLGKYYDMIERLMSKFAVLLRLTKLLFSVIYFSHLVGNIFCGNSPTVANNLFSQYYNSAISADFYSNMAYFIMNNFAAIYFNSLFTGIYWMMMNELDVVNSWEKMYQVVVLGVSIGLNASIFGNVAVLLENVSFGLSPILQAKVDIMKEYMFFMEFDDSFITQISDYHLNLWMKQRNMLYPEGFFDDMALSLQKTFLIDQWKKTFFEVSKFLKVVSKSFFLDMVPKLKPKIYMRNDIMITEGDNTSEVYFMSSTSITHIKIGGEWVKNLESGDYFGEISMFLVSTRRTASVICLKDSDFLILEGDIFQTFLRDYPEDYEKIKSSAIQKFLSSMKLYPTSLFAKIVPNLDKQSYLIRKCIYLPTTEEIESETVVGNSNSTIINLDPIMNKIEFINIIFNDIKSKLIKMNGYFADNE